MSFLGRWEIDDVLTFPANTHAADTGAATDADGGTVSWRLYEDETATPILTGTMATLDATNTTGFYSEQITLSAANGFEVGKSYTIYIEAAVDSVTGSMSHTFQVEAAPATAAAVAALNDLSAAEVNAEVDTAISDAALATEAQVAAIEADTQDIQSRLPAALVSGRMDSNMSAINDSVTAAIKLALSAQAIGDGIAVAGTLSTTALTTDLAETSDDHWNGRSLIFISGDLTFQGVTITDYDGATKLVTHSGLTAAPTADDVFVIL